MARRSGDHRFALALGDGAFHHLAVHIEADRFDMSVLLASQQVSGAAQLQIESCNPKPRAQIAELLQCCQPLARDGRKRGIRRHQQICIRALVGTPNAAAKLV